MKRVGILGGMGPEATLLLMKKIMAGVLVQDDSDHIPMIVHQNTQVPSRIKRILDGKGDDPVPVLQQMALDLEHMKCDFLAMPCNTAHYYYQQISKMVSIPLLNMIELSARSLAALDLSKIGILASPALKKIGVFDESFNSYQLESKFVENDVDMLKLITEIKKGSLGNTTVDNFKLQVTKLADYNCDGILIACTELSLLKEHVPKSLTILDSLDCLVDSIINESIK